MKRNSAHPIDSYRLQICAFIFALAAVLAMFINPAHSAETTAEAPTENPQDFAQIFSANTSEDESEGESWIERKWHSLRATATIKTDQELGDDAFNVAVGLRRRVQPAFARGQQQLLDMYYARLGFDSRLIEQLAGEFGANAEIGVQMTFSRLFQFNQKEFWKKVGPAPYWVNRFPWTHNVATQRLVPGEAARLEANLAVGLGFAKSDHSSRYDSSAFAGITTGARFIADVYRIQGNRVRLRLIAQKNDGCFAIPISITTNIASDLSRILRTQIQRQVRGSAGFDFSFCGVKDRPLETQMADYEFDLSKPEAQVAYDAVMGAIRKFQFYEVFRPTWFTSTKDKKDRLDASDRLSQEFRKYTTLADEQAIASKNRPANQRSVARYFLGKTISDGSTRGVHLTVRIVERWLDLRGSNTNSRNFVVTQDLENRVSFRLMGTEQDRSVQTIQPLFIPLYDKMTLGTYSVLLDSDERATSGAISDLTAAFEVTDISFTRRNMKGLRQFFGLNLPSGIVDRIDWNLLTAQDLRDARIRYAVIFNEETLESIPSLSRAELYTRLMNYIQSRPDNHWFTASPPTCGDACPSNGSDPMMKFEGDAHVIATGFEQVLSAPDVSADRLAGFNQARSVPLFKDVAVGFLVSLLPPERAAGLIGFSLHVSSDSGTYSFQNNRQKTSVEFDTVTYQLNLLNNSEFDVRLQASALP